MKKTLSNYYTVKFSHYTPLNSLNTTLLNSLTTTPKTLSNYYTVNFSHYHTGKSSHYYQAIRSLLLGKFFHYYIVKFSHCYTIKFSHHYPEDVNIPAHKTTHKSS